MDFGTGLEQGPVWSATHVYYSVGDALNAILNYWVEELRMNYIALAIALG